MNILGQKEGADWVSYHGDCVEVMAGLAPESIHYSVYSPPFASLFTYSASDRDMGNVRDHEEFHEQYRFALDAVLRVTKPGRLMSVHCMCLPTSKVKDGVIGLTDFPGRIVRAAEEAGWVYHSKVTIWKDPVTAMQRTKALGLLHRQLMKDSCRSRQGIPDEVLTFRKPGDNPELVAKMLEPTWPKNERESIDRWQKWASPVWTDIDQSNTLQYMSAREDDDERHLCPLQLDAIERCILLWSNPGDTVLSPYMGIGSEGYVALRSGRRFVGAELKESYFKQACANLHNARRQLSLLERSAP